ncbi:MAG: hypothetical protein OIN66_12065 [Candidatus Methanoperedens sp.]|nr:hypothetical protein [Candidatus Methanoperedens sp.]
MANTNNSDELIFFWNCAASKEEIDRLKSNDKIISIHYVCGIDPWLIICKSNIKDVFDFGSSYRLKIKYNSFAERVRWRNEVSNPKDKIIFWVFIKGKDIKYFINEMTENANSEGYKIAEVYDVFGEFQAIVKIYAQNVNGVDNFLTSCRSEGLSTSTKCVLYTVKENGTIIDSNIETKRKRANDAKKEINYAIARIMFNTRGFVQKTFYAQKELLVKELTKMNVPFVHGTLDKYILNPDITKSEYSRDDLVHYNSLIDRYSVKLEKNAWLKTLFFFKAGTEPTQKDKLEKVIQKELLGVKPTKFARKLYHITGDYDFMVPFDCMNIEELNQTIDDFLKNWGELITSFTNTICRPVEGEEAHSLVALDIPLIESLLINATQITQFEDIVRGRSIFSPILDGDDLMIAEEGITPREDYVRYEIKNKDKPSIDDYLQRFTSFGSIGVEPTIEFKNGALIQAYTKLYLKDFESKKGIIFEINEKIRKYEILCIVYEPIRDPLTVMCVLMVKDLVELEVLFEDFLKKYCKKIEYHVIFHQGYYSRAIEQNIRCKPCFYPFVPRRFCSKDCEMCEEQRDCIKQNCGKCIRYILPRQRNRKLNIDFDSKAIKSFIKITLVGVDLSLYQYFALEKLLDQEGRRNRILNEYKNLCNKLGGKAIDVYESYEDLVTKYEKIIDRDRYREKYKTAINNVLKRILASGSDIIIFPEYSIPFYVYDTIRKFDIENDCIIVAGSYVNNELFNVCPIIFNESKEEKKIYHYYKNKLSPFEKDLGLIKNRGTAYLKFLNSPYGNIYVQLCYDAFEFDNEALKDVDILVVPSYNTASGFVGGIKENANNYKLVAVYANTKNEGDIKSSFFIPPEEARQANRNTVKPLHPNMWQGGITEDKIFEISPDNNQFEEIKDEEKEFSFKLKHLYFNLAQLNKRRGIYSRRSA